MNRNICLNCTLPTCDETDPRCPYNKGLNAQQRWYIKLKKSPARLADQKAKWAEAYQRRRLKTA